jgi:hypothetical protein
MRWSSRPSRTPPSCSRSDAEEAPPVTLPTVSRLRGAVDDLAANDQRGCDTGCAVARSRNCRGQNAADPRSTATGLPSALDEPLRDDEQVAGRGRRKGGLWTTCARRYERVNQTTGGLERRAAKVSICTALRQQPPGQSNSMGRPLSQPTAAGRRQFGQSSQVTRSLGSIVSPPDPARWWGREEIRPAVRARDPLRSRFPLALGACHKRLARGRLVPVRPRAESAGQAPFRGKTYSPSRARTSSGQGSARPSCRQT